MLLKIKNFLISSHTQRFCVLDLKKNSKLQLSETVRVVLYDNTNQASYETLTIIKGNISDWNSRWQKGHKCYMAYCSGEPAAYVWASDDYWRVRKGHRLPDKSAFLYDGITIKKWRNKGVFQAVLSKITDDFFAKGYKKLYCVVDDKNNPSKHALQKLGFCSTNDIIHIYKFLRVFRFQFENIASKDLR
jgi:L-amino acid N-acyltransferase YncA